ncbi:hypothetical protein SALB1_2497 [Salinisphaera sp. LB1]|nr:hypothetical protein SALB1_2497 [Salinisphaera sp. LB1]
MALGAAARCVIQGRYSSASSVSTLIARARRRLLARAPAVLLACRAARQGVREPRRTPGKRVPRARPTPPDRAFARSRH